MCINLAIDIILLDGIPGWKLAIAIDFVFIAIQNIFEGCVTELREVLLDSPISEKLVERLLERL